MYPEGHYGAIYIPGVTNVFFTEEHVDFLNEFGKKQCESRELSAYRVDSAQLHELINMHVKKCECDKLMSQGATSILCGGDDVMLKMIQSVANDKQMKVNEVDSYEILASSDKDAGEMLRTLFDHKNIIVINHIDSLLRSGGTVPCRKVAFVKHLGKAQQSNGMLIAAFALNIAAVDEYVRGESDEEVSFVIPDEKRHCDLLMDLSCGAPSLYQLIDVW